jgi:hypothetical protein
MHLQCQHDSTAPLPSAECSAEALLTALDATKKKKTIWRVLLEGGEVAGYERGRCRLWNHGASSPTALGALVACA